MIPLCRLLNNQKQRFPSYEIKLNHPRLWRGRCLKFKLSNLFEKVDLSFCLVTSWGYMKNENDFYNKVKLAEKGGVSHVQIRGSFDELLQNQRVACRLVNSGSTVIFNGDPKSVLSIGAHGFHGGENDPAYEEVRALLGPNAVIGYTVNSEEDVIQANKIRPDYIGVHLLPSKITKPKSKRIWGFNGLEWIRSKTDLPIIVIGGITKDNLSDICPYLKKGDGIGVVGDVLREDDPSIPARKISDILEKFGLRNNSTTNIVN